MAISHLAAVGLRAETFDPGLVVAGTRLTGAQAIQVISAGRYEGTKRRVTERSRRRSKTARMRPALAPDDRHRVRSRKDQLRLISRRKVSLDGSPIQPLRRPSQPGTRL